MKLKKIFITFIMIILLSSFAFAKQFITSFKVSDKDESNPDRKFYSFKTAFTGDWYIIEDTSTTTRYLQGETEDNYDIAWSSRTLNTYYEINDVYNTSFSP